MEININQKKISIGAKYNIFIERQPVYRAAVKLFSFIRTINLFKESGDEPVLTIKKRFWSWPIKKYDIIRQDHSVIPYRVIKLLRMHFRCIDGNNVYDIYGHKGTKSSIFKNDVQVAWWDQEQLAWFDGDNYTIIADKDADIELLIAIVLIDDDAYSRNKKGNTATIHLGSPWEGVRPFNPDWRPKM